MGALQHQVFIPVPPQLCTGQHSLLEGHLSLNCHPHLPATFDRLDREQQALQKLVQEGRALGPEARLLGARAGRVLALGGQGRLVQGAPPAQAGRQGPGPQRQDQAEAVDSRERREQERKAKP